MMLGRGASFVLVERIPCQVWVRHLLLLLTGIGQYFAAFAKLRPGQEEKFPALMAASQVERTGKPENACRYHTWAPTLSKL